MNLNKRAMKKHCYQSITAILLLIFCISGCKNDGKNNKQKLTFDSIKVEKTAYLFNDTTKPSCQLEVNFTYIKSAKSEDLSDSLNSHFVQLAFDKVYTKGNLEFIINRFAEDYANGYKSDLEPMYLEDERNKNDEEIIEAWYSYRKTINTSVQFFNNSYLVYRNYYDEYSGGAHGIYKVTFLNIDLKNKKSIALKDIFVNNYSLALTDLIWNQLMAENNVSSHEELEDLGYGSVNDIKPTENFYLTKEGITFFYNVYDITPYSMGAIEVKLPYSLIDRLLNKENPVIKELIN